MKKKRKAKKKAKPQFKSLTLVVDRDMKERLELIATDASTDIPTVAQVLLATGMHMGRNSAEAALRDAAATVLELQAKLGRCRQVMEANDPGNAREIFGEPYPAEGVATVP